MIAEEIRVRGTVQGVGFRPTVYRLAKACGLKGEVCNDGEGVLIRVAGAVEFIEEFVQKLHQECPPLAKIEAVIRRPYLEKFEFDEFIITASIQSIVHTAIVPDAATCPQCKEETLNPFYRWYRYPFTNCTHCGPRLSIVRAIPYDRTNTSMANFPMCSECKQDYQNIENRRFHAQPVACHLCGPKAWLERADGKPVTASMFSRLDDVDAVCTLLQKGFIVAIKGIGGIHLACDATQETAVQMLRNRKRRYHKPFALMARDLAVIKEYCILNEQEKALLASPAAPIVLLEATGKKQVAPSVRPGQKTLGFMLPYTPLHHLILKRMDRPIVLTSGNLSDEPQCIDNEEARNKLGKIADYFLLHNREIVNRVDDSVARIVEGKIQVIRRARGMAPAPLSLPPGFETVPHLLAMGGELKSTVCLLRDGQAILSQHLGDLENAAAFKAYQETLNLYLQLFEHQPEAIAFDLHPEYLSTKLGQELATGNQLNSYPIQHHHAHIAACMAENCIPLDTPPVLGIALDGLGYGDDGTLWGGEFLLANYQSYQRLATLKPVPMIGGSQAIYQPWRNTYAHLNSAFQWPDLNAIYGDLELIRFLNQKPHQLLNQMVETGINSPFASSTGRLFDAVAAALNICRERCSYEGQAAMEMEALIDINSLNNDKEIPAYPFEIGTLHSREYVLCRDVETNVSTYYCLEPRPMWQALLSDLQQQTSQAIIAAKFHKGLAQVIVKLVQQLQLKNAIEQVVLSGGVFQNRILQQQVSQRLEALGIQVLTHRLVPANDGGISLGQAMIAAAQLMTKPSTNP